MIAQDHRQAGRTTFYGAHLKQHRQLALPQVLHGRRELPSFERSTPFGRGRCFLHLYLGQFLSQRYSVYARHLLSLLDDAVYKR